MATLEFAAPRESSKLSLRGNPWITVVILTAIYTSAFLDRSVMSLLAEPIRKDLGLTDFQISILLGFAFVLFYTIVNVPAGDLIDRLDRRKLILVSGICWSISTVACGLSTSFWHLFLARMALGVSEAFIAPASFALLRDRIHVEQRGRAFSIFAMAPFLGSALSMMLGGALLRSAVAGQAASVPFFGELAAWQFVLVVIGFVALMPVFFILILKGDADRHGGGAARHGIRAAIAHVALNRRAYTFLFGYVTCAAAIMLGRMAWSPTMLSRTYGIPLDTIGFISGPLGLVCGLSGLVIAGFVLDNLQKQGRSLAGFSAAIMALTGLFAIGSSMMPHAWQAWTCLGLSSFFGGAFYPIGGNVLARITPSPVMGKVTSIYLLLQALVGAASGPMIIALMTEHLFSGHYALAYAMALFSLIFGGGGALFALGLDARHSGGDVAGS